MMEYKHLQIRNENNIKGRDFIIGDLHGMYDMLMDKMYEANFNYNDDRLFSVGDLIDRGPDSMRCLKLIDQSWFYPVMGNHEDMMCRNFYNSQALCWRENGGAWIEKENIDEVKSYVDKLIANVPISRVVETTGNRLIGISHAQPDGSIFITDNDFSRKNGNTMMWGRDIINCGVGLKMKDVDETYHGHTIVDNILVMDDQTFIDTGAGSGGKLTMMLIE